MVYCKRVLCLAVLAGSAQSAQSGCAWRSVPLPALDDVRLFDVEVVAEDDVWVVGVRDDFTRSLILHYDGRAFSVVQAPSPFRFQNSLRAVSAVATDDVWAVGSGVVQQEPNFVYVPLALHFDGTAWRHVPPPRVRSKFGGSLNAIAAISSNDVWAFGDADQNGDWVGLAQRWNGMRWRTVSVPGAGPFGAVAALGPARLWVATLDLELFRWNGRRWLRITPGAITNASGGFHGFSALTDKEVWVVGAYAAGPIAARFVGRRLRDLPIPYSHFKGSYQAREDSSMGDVLAFAPNDVLAVSNFGIEQHDGRRWRKVSPTSSLSALDAVSRDDVWAVGSKYKSGAGWQGVAMRYSCL